MSVVENSVEKPAFGLMHQAFALRCVAGALLGLAALWLIFAGVPLSWNEVAASMGVNPTLSSALLLIVSLVLIAVLAYSVYKAAQKPTEPGLRAGIVFSAVAIFASLWIVVALGERLADQFEPSVGLGMCVVLLAALIGGWGFLLTTPGMGRWLASVEETGFFHFNSYKGNQGVRVRRATVLGILVLGLTGIVTLVRYKAFGFERPELPPNDWWWTLPFTRASLTSADGVAEVARAVPLMFKVHLVLPLLMGVLVVWLAWRIVNMPAFADFLIATEAEMNKVSWTSRQRLYQDTIVVLVTTFLLTVFLFLLDVLWIQALGSPWIRVLIINPREAAAKQQEKTQW